MEKIFSKRILSALVFVALLCGIVSASLNPKVQLQNYSLSEAPAQPGSEVNLTLMLKSIEWDNCAERTSVQIITSYPLSVEGPDTQYLGTLCFLYPPENGTVTFTLPVDSLGQPGTYPVTVITNYEKRFSKFTESNTINVRVGGSPSFTASVASSQPADIYPGDSAQVTVVFQNGGTGRAEAVRAAFSASDGIEVKWAGSSQELGQVASHGSASSTFTIEVPKDTAPGNYSLYANLSYVSSEGNGVSAQSFAFEIPISKKAEFEASADKSAQLIAGRDAGLSISLRNMGSTEARKLKVMIRPVFPFSTDGTVRYIDSLAPGKAENLTYLIHIDKDGTPGEQIAGLLIEFEDKEGKKFSDSIDFSMMVKTRSFEESIGDYWYVGAIAGVIVIIVILKKLAGAIRRKG